MGERVICWDCKHCARCYTFPTRSRCLLFWRIEIVTGYKLYTFCSTQNAKGDCPHFEERPSFWKRDKVLKVEVK